VQLWEADVVEFDIPAAPDDIIPIRLVGIMGPKQPKNLVRLGKKWFHFIILPILSIIVILTRRTSL